MNSRCRFRGALAAPLLATAMAVAACGQEAPIADPPGAVGTSILLRGHTVPGHEVPSFRPCDSTNPLRVIDLTGVLTQQLRVEFARVGEPYREIFAVVEGTPVPAPTEGTGADYSGALEVEAVLYAGVEGPGCDFAWDTFHLRARGNEPFWMVEVSDDGMRFMRPDGPERAWSIVERTETPDGLVFRPRRRPTSPPPAAVDLGTELVVRRQPCRDSMSGAYFGAAAEFRFGDEIFVGCTLVGTPPPER